MRVPAKINLFLAVRRRRDDGMHDIVSVMQTVGLRDQIVVSLTGPPQPGQRPGASSDRDGTPPATRLAVSHDADQQLPTGEGNLVTRAATRLADRIGLRIVSDNETDTAVRATRVHVNKRIPIAAGLAGGSADAAATLVALHRLWEADLSDEDLAAVAGELGADVPFCLQGGTALTSDTGTTVARLADTGRHWWVLGISDKPMATREVYRAWDKACRPGDTTPDGVLDALDAGDPRRLAGWLHNELQPAATRLHPRLVESRQAMLDAGALGAIVSGSGPTIIALTDSEAHAHDVARTVGARFHRVEVATSPAGGPHVLDPDA